MSTVFKHEPAKRKTPRIQGAEADQIAANLEDLGLLGGGRKRSKKSVDFNTAKRDSGVDYRPPSRASQFSRASRATETGRTTPIGGAGIYRSNSTVPRSSRGMAGVLDLDRTRGRRDRTFIGAECAVCEEPLEHTLRGERILQLSCAHVAHEACFYEYIREFDSQYCPTCSAPLGLDSSRGGNVLDMEKLSSIVRQNDPPPRSQSRQQGGPSHWDLVSPSEETLRPMQRDPRNDHMRDSDYSGRQPSSRSGAMSHNRNDSGATGMVSSEGVYADPHNPIGRRHDYDVQSMETSLSSPRALLKNPIPPPSVTVRSEFPTITRSRQQQSLTCLVTVEVTEGKWRPDIRDIRQIPPMPSLQSPERANSIRSKGSKGRMGLIYGGTQESLDEITEELHSRVENWHGLEFSRFGKLRLHGHIRVGKDRRAWQELDCYLFSEMLICVKEKKLPPGSALENGGPSRKPKCNLKGSILIKKHLKHVEASPDDMILTLSLSVTELPSFHLQFQDRSQYSIWNRALHDINDLEFPGRALDFDQDNSGTDEEDYRSTKPGRVTSMNSSFGAAKSYQTAPTEYSNYRSPLQDQSVPLTMHVPVDIVVVIPVSSSMAGLKISLLRDALRFVVGNMGEKDRMGLVTFGSSGGGVPIVGMTGKSWNGWSKILDSIRPVGQKSLRADVVEGANVAMDLLMQRKSTNPIASILLISDSSTSDPESVDFVVQRAEAAKVVIHSFGLGLTHKPDTMIELSTRTKASFTYVKDWMMLRECVAGCLGSLQTISHQNAKLRLRLPEGSPARFVKISGALHVTKRATGRDAEAALGDLRFGDKRDILVQLAIPPENASAEQLAPQDPWETIISGLEALGKSDDQEDQRALSVEEVPLIQADLAYGDILRDGTVSHLSRPSLLAITMLPASSRSRSVARPPTPPIPPHPSIVQRRMELLTSDMLTRALTLVSRGQHERAHHLLSETRSILKGLGKGGLPPLPTPGSTNKAPKPPSTPNVPTGPSSPVDGEQSRGRRTPSPHSTDGAFGPPASGIDAVTMKALDAELESSLEWINHPAVFGRDSRKAVLQAIGVISSQRGYTFRTPAESLWAERIKGIKVMAERSREWREEKGDEAINEEG